MLAFYNQFSGINVVNIYSTDIFEQLNAQSDKPPLDIALANTLVAVSGSVGCLLSAFTFAFLAKR